MSLLSFFRPAPPAIKPLTPDQIDTSQAIIELIYAGNDLARHLQCPTDNRLECFCGARVHTYPNPPEHARFCPVKRYNDAVELAKKAIR